jgi:acetoacetyl-CoA synthetase
MKYCKARHPGVCTDTYDAFWQWSVDELSQFWAAVWDYVGVVHSAPYSAVLENPAAFPGCTWFPGARLNFAENLLKHAAVTPDATAYVYACDASRAPQRMSYRELADAVARVAAALRAAGVRVGDRVAGFMPNTPDAAVAMLATVAVGAVWSSCSPDFGQMGVVDRFGQVEPKVMFTVESYFYRGKQLDILPKIQSIIGSLPTLESTVVFRGCVAPAFRVDLSALPGAVHIEDFIAQGGPPAPAAPPLRFEQVAFDHPVYVMFSSGTTGKPKCIVQGAGVLLNHLKELVLHTDVRPTDRLFYYTTTGWMMWNWLTSGLGVGATLCLYEGNPCYPAWDSLWAFAAAEGVTVFGTSARYLQSIMEQGVRPGASHDLSRLRTICTTGSPASDAVFHYIYDHVKADVQFASISGGTDLNGCFALGCPLLPVHSTELQCRGLGMKVAVLDDHSAPCVGHTGELVCQAPFPSMPLHFLNDPSGAAYRAAYFENVPGIWCHGDFAEMTARGGMVVHGRSDATLNPGGVRLGTADIYAAIDAGGNFTDAVADSLVVGQAWQSDVRVVLFLKMKPGVPLTPELKKAICARIRASASPRHVPELVLACPDVPYTMSGKKVEIAVRNMIDGRPVKNRSALANPDSLDWFAHVPELRAGSGRPGQ